MLGSVSGPPDSWTCGEAGTIHSMFPANSPRLDKHSKACYDTLSLESAASYLEGNMSGLRIVVQFTILTAIHHPRE